MIADQRSPALRWRAPLLGHVLGDRGLPYLNTKLKSANALHFCPAWNGTTGWSEDHKKAPPGPDGAGE
jgi:hypothetical protein